jgi:hypothetical protein
MPPPFKIKPNEAVDDDTLNRLSTAVVDKAKELKIRPTVLCAQLLDYIKKLKYLPSEEEKK